MQKIKTIQDKQITASDKFTGIWLDCELSHKTDLCDRIYSCKLMQQIVSHVPLTRNKMSLLKPASCRERRVDYLFRETER